MSTMMKPLFSLLLLLCITVAPCRAGDTSAVYFPLGKAELDAQAMRTIDELIKKREIKRGEQVMIIGYCDYIGGKRKNDSLSYQRAENVQLYLLSKDFSLRDIELCIGKGKIERKGMSSKEGYQPDRKVDIVKKSIEPPKPPVAVAKVKTPPKPEKHVLAEITKMDVNQIVSLNRIFFEPGTHVLIESSEPQLDSLYTILKDNPKIKIQIEGHICCLISSPGGRPVRIFKKDKENDPDTPLDVYEDGTPDLLSFARARAIRDFLTGKGIAENRIHYKGLGMTHNDAVKENSEADMQHNRRVDIRIVEK